MARMHARRKGKSGSTRMFTRTEHPVWSALKPREVESRILELTKQGYSTSQIGMILRDQYAVPNIKLATGKKISRILRENRMQPEVPEDMKNLISTALKLRTHIDSNHNDYANKRNLQLTESKIRRLAKYYKGTQRLPETWKYSPKLAKLLFE
ncbi:MAG: 30S ribosomal protein S15 [Candidatus Thermoplasmatota archaeon]|jgi:small subunit ribosomal protein S15|nr:30S ribosomal protein S15 [Candidatus Thermoplasmatota archaeon]